MAIPSQFYGPRRADMDALAIDNGGPSAQDFSLLLERVAELEDDLRKQVRTPTSSIDNLLRGSDFDHSLLSYTGAGANDEVFGWFRGADTTRPIRDAGTDPLWDKANGWLEWSSNNAADDLSYHFPQRLIRPGRILHLMFNARLKAAAGAQGVKLTAGIWDESGGIQNWVEDSIVGSASSLAPVVTKVGPGAATTNYQYRVVAQTDEPSVIVSTAGSVTGAATLDATDYNNIAWSAVPGVTRYRVYRVTPNAGLISDITGGATSFNDQGVTLQAGAQPPEPAPARATIDKNDFGASLGLTWKTFRAVIRVPRAYDFSRTGSDKQWLRLRLSGAAPPVILFDRAGLSVAPGLWAPAPDDRAAAGDVVISPIGDGGQYLGDFGRLDDPGRFPEIV